MSIRPHPEKAYKGGEDAGFANENLLAVADGVGGWAQSGVDPALYSKNLIKMYVIITC
jgi:protein phosphatase PTC7